MTISAVAGTWRSTVSHLTSSTGSAADRPHHVVFAHALGHRCAAGETERRLPADRDCDRHLVVPGALPGRRVLADMLGLPHQDRNLGLARHHATVDADIHHAGVVVLGDAAAIGEEIAPAVEPVPPRRWKVVEVDVGAGDDVLLHRAGGDDPGGNAAAENVAAHLHEFARMGVGGDAEHHGDAPVARQPAAEHPPAPGIGAIVLDVVEQQRRAVAGALGEPHDGADLDLPVDLRIDLLDLAGGVERLDPAAEIAIGDRLAFDVHCLFQFVLPQEGRSWGRRWGQELRPELCPGLAATSTRAPRAHRKCSEWQACGGGAFTRGMPAIS